MACSPCPHTTAGSAFKNMQPARSLRVHAIRPTPPLVRRCIGHASVSPLRASMRGHGIARFPGHPRRTRARRRATPAVAHTDRIWYNGRQIPPRPPLPAAQGPVVEVRVRRAAAAGLRDRLLAFSLLNTVKVFARGRLARYRRR